MLSKPTPVVDKGVFGLKRPSTAMTNKTNSTDTSIVGIVNTPIKP